MSWNAMRKKTLQRMGYRHPMPACGFRRIASALLRELGFRHHAIELQLVHQACNSVCSQCCLQARNRF